MIILFDQGVPVPLRRHLSGHKVDTAFERGWSSLGNGALLDHAESDGYQILVLLAASWPRIERRVDEIRSVVKQIKPGQCTEIPI